MFPFSAQKCRSARSPSNPALQHCACAPLLNARSLDGHMRRVLMKGLVAIAMIAFCACEPAFRFAGRVTTPNGQPAPGAEVWIQCGDSDKNFRSTTDQAGRFERGGVGWRPASCLARAHAAGYADITVTIMSACKKKPSHLSDACLEVVIDPWQLNSKAP